ncbi:hypothetical protein C497_19409 [Halalkalicoccus jeotgali B3]|uniref:Ribbon-helix-helix protein CopG domain-containing protein n=2 Tax=Halalkalicoccus jeotgali TaxID=413810 RepID=D8JDB2_HALJB|nr:ribbon-helix-helix protein, CopG family [Halalkalicoccus jeotgali]ADJ17264.1 hypothetical protein HacjB3_19648 [Halalkalicoccus jeotgali B3]ELY32579.1 hypothetical protein C497_19409 [Halalkalicoccus jeotgali B3]
MQSITIKLSSETIDSLNSIAEAEHDGNRSDAVRELLSKGMDYDALEARHKEAQQQLRAVNARQEDVGELVEHVERERELQQRERERRDAPIWQRAKWWVLGRS